MSTRSFLVPESLQDYIAANWVDEPEVLRRLREETARHPQAGMQISPDQGQFMAVLVQALRVNRALEIGVFTGYSSTVVAMALPSNGTLVACDISDEFTQVARKYWVEAGVADKIELHIGPALATLSGLERSSFDLCFIDADKENYIAYFDAAIGLVRPGGVILADNVLWSGRVADDSQSDQATEAIRSFNSYVHKHPRVKACLLPIGDGVTMAVLKD